MSISVIVAHLRACFKGHALIDPVLSIGTSITFHRSSSLEDLAGFVEMMLRHELLALQVSLTSCVLGPGDPKKGFYPYPSTSLVEELAARTQGLSCCIHMPYGVTLTSSDPRKQKATKAHFAKSAKIGKILGCSHLTFHCGSSKPQNAEESVLKGLIEAKSRLGDDILLAPEVAGKRASFGEFRALAHVAAEAGVVMTWDIAHDFARGGAVTQAQDLRERLSVLDRLHGSRKVLIHLSGVIGGSRGEKEHTSLEDPRSGVPWRLFLSVLRQERIMDRCIIICESRGPPEGGVPLRIRDAVLMKEFLESNEETQEWQAPRDRLDAFF